LIRIICKYIQNEDDLTYKEDFRDLAKNSLNGMIEIIVQDSGVGIKEEDQSKLFKLFGFLDETKDLNTGGVGLGLHICKMIVQQFGGDIICKSKFGTGTSFIFLIALNNKLD
jgi:signal transduction histidine kinase